MELLLLSRREANDINATKYLSTSHVTHLMVSCGPHFEHNLNIHSSLTVIKSSLCADPTLLIGTIALILRA